MCKAFKPSNKLGMIGAEKYKAEKYCRWYNVLELAEKKQSREVLVLVLASNLGSRSTTG